MKSEPKAFASLSSGLLARKGAARPAMRPQGFGQGGNGLEDLGWNDMGYDTPKPSLVPVVDGDTAFVSRSPLAGLTPISPVHDQQAEIEHRFTSCEVDDGELDEDGEVADASRVLSFASLAGSYAPEPEEADDESEPLELSAEVAEDVQPEVSAAEVDAYAPLVPFASAFERPAAAPVVTPEPEPEPELEPELDVAPPLAVMPTSVARPAPVRQPKDRSETSAKGKAAFTLRLDPSRHLKLRLACAVTAQSAQQLVTRALDELLASMPELEAMAERAPAKPASRKG